MDRVQVVKREQPELGGNAADELPYDAPLNPQQDAIEVAGVFIQDASNRDQNVLIDRASGELRLRDTKVTRTIAELLRKADHPAVRQLIHFIEQGPAEGFASGAYRELLPVASPFPTSIIWWESSAKLKKIVEEAITYNANKTIGTDQWKVYDTDGATVLATVTDTVAYLGIFETSRTRAIA